MGLNVAKLIAKAFAANGKPVGVQSCTLIKRTPGTRDPLAPSAGTNPIETSYKATGLVSDWSSYMIAGGLVKTGDRKLLLFGASIESGQVPEPGDKVVIDGETLVILPQPPISRDPAKACFVLNSRK